MKVFNAFVMGGIFSMLILAVPGICFPTVVHNPDSLVLHEVKTHDVVFLGTKHRQAPILHFIATLLPQLAHAGVTDIALEISSAQQPQIDAFMKAGKGLKRIKISSIIDCPDYRHLLQVIRLCHLTPVAIDLPRSMWNSSWTRDEWMARQLSAIFDRTPRAKVFVIVGMMHVFKRLHWTDPEIKDQCARCDLARLRPHKKLFSIAESIGAGSGKNGYWQMYGDSTYPVAVETRQIDLNLAALNLLAIKPMKTRQAVDAVIVY